MDKQLIVCISAFEHKYFYNPEFEDIPSEIKQELVEATAHIAEQVNGIISVGFYQNGTVYIEQTLQDNILVDEIGADLEIKRFQKEKKELIKSLTMWYMVYRTKEGEIVKNIILMKAKGLDEKQILEKIRDVYGEEQKDFAKSLLEETNV